MITKTYRNINVNFTFKNVCLELILFWINEVVKSNYSKIWLTIIIINKNNRSSLLIKNLPFDTSVYTDIIIVLKQTLETKKSVNKDILKTIVFKYHFEKPKHVYNWNVFSKIIVNIILFLITLFTIIACLFFIFSDTNELFNIALNENQLISNNKVQEIPLEILSRKYCIFDPFIKLFNTSNTVSYIPNYFIPSKLEVKNLDFNLLEYIIHNQYIILDYYTMDSTKQITELNKILEQYKTIIDKLL